MPRQIKVYAPPKKKVSQLKQLLSAIHGALVTQMKVSDKLSPVKGKNSGGKGR